MRQRWRALHPIIRLTVLTHLCWAMLIVVQVGRGEPIKLITAMASFSAALPNPMMQALALSGIAFMALWAGGPGRRAFCWALGQQAVMTLGCVDILTSALTGRYPDGYETHGLFILRDQLPWVLLTYYHTKAMLR